MRLILTILFVTFSLISVSAQENRDFRFHDSLTYNLYLSERWEELVVAGNEALDDGFDYYYLRMRLGIAKYSRSDYTGASGQFRKAILHNLNDPIAIEYLYYCYSRIGEYAIATSFLKQLSPQHVMRILVESGLARNSAAITVYYNNFDTQEITESPGEWFTENVVGTETVSKMIINPSVSMSHYLKPGLYYSHAFNNLTKVSFLHYNDGTNSLYLDDQKVYQNQYYGSFVVAGSHGLTFRPYFHLVYLVYEYIYSTGSVPPFSYFVGSDNTFKYTSGFNLRQRTSHIAIDGGVSFNNFGTGTAYQWEGGAYIYPLGNGKLYAGGRITSVIQSDRETAPQTNPVFTINAGFSVADKVWVDLLSYRGDFRNMTTGNGLYVFNSPDYITSRLLVNISIPFKSPSGPTLLIGGGINNHRTAVYSTDNTLTNNQIIDYKSYNLNGGIIWNF